MYRRDNRFPSLTIDVFSVFIPEVNPQPREDMSEEKKRRRRTSNPELHKQPTVRFQVEILECRLGQIGEIMGRTGLRTKRELFDHAMAILEWAAKETASGNTVGSQTTAGEFQKLITPTLINVAAIAKATEAK